MLELVEMGETGPARALVRQTKPLQLLKELDPDRYLELENALVNRRSVRI